MPFKVRCRITSFLGDANKYPCHFGYKVGDEFIYDGIQFIGKVCPYVIRGLLPHIMAIFIAGNKYCERMMFRYGDRGDIESLSRVQGGLPPSTERGRGWNFICPDVKTLAFFIIEPYGLAENTPTYRRQMKIIEMLKKQTGLSVNDIRDKLGVIEKAEKSKDPLPSPVGMDVLMEELADADYVELRDSKYYLKPQQAK